MSPSISEIINRRNELERLYNGARQEPIWLCIVSSTGPEKQKQTIDNFLFYLEEYLNYPISNPPTVEEEKELSDRFLLLVKFFYHCEETIAWKYLKTTTSRTIQQFLDGLSSFFALVLDLSPEHSQHQQQSDHEVYANFETVPTDQTSSAASGTQALFAVTESVTEESTYDPPWDDRPLRFIKTMAAFEAHRSTNVLPTVPSSSAAAPRPLPVVTESVPTSEIPALFAEFLRTNCVGHVPKEFLVAYLEEAIKFNSGGGRRDKNTPDFVVRLANFFGDNGVGHLPQSFLVNHLEEAIKILNRGGGQSDNNSRTSKFGKFIATLKKKKK